MDDLYTSRSCNVRENIFCLIPTSTDRKTYLRLSLASQPYISAYAHARAKVGGGIRAYAHAHTRKNTAGSSPAHFRTLMRIRGKIRWLARLSPGTVQDPRRACAARVTVVSVCLSVCLSLCVRLFSDYRLLDGL